MEIVKFIPQGSWENLRIFLRIGIEREEILLDKYKSSIEKRKVQQGFGYGIIEREEVWVTPKLLEFAINFIDYWDEDLIEILANMSNMKKELGEAESYDDCVFDMAKKIGIEI